MNDLVPTRVRSAIAATLLLSLAGHVLAVPVISDGSDGAFNPTASLTINLGTEAPDGIFNFTDINIPTGVTVRFQRNSANTPVYFAATGNVVIDGTIDVSAGGGSPGPGGFAGGTAGAGSVRDGTAGAGLSPGGGGVGAAGFSELGRAGGGGGMGTPGLTATSRTGSPPAPGGDRVIFPEPVLAGGSGGGGGGRGRFFGVDLSGGDGGAGGGAFQISTPADIALGGSLIANGGHGGYAFANAFSHAGPGGGGSGGSFELNASSIVVDNGASISAIGGAGGGLSTEPVSRDPFFYSSGANGGLGYVLFDAASVFIDPGASIEAAALGTADPGSTPDSPVLPDPPITPDVFVFNDPTPGRWFDPPLVDGFVYAISGDAAAEFTLVDVPPTSFGFAAIDLVVDGALVATLTPDGGGFDFLAAGLFGVQTFNLVGIEPLLDAADPGFPTAFPTFLDWSGAPTLLTMTPIEVVDPGGVPEPSTVLLLALGLVGGACARRRLSVH